MTDIKWCCDKIQMAVSEGIIQYHWDQYRHSFLITSFLETRRREQISFCPFCGTKIIIGNEEL